MKLELGFAKQSLKEELKAIKDYQSRIKRTKDTKLKTILKHNLREEKEHAKMLKGWIKKHV